MSRLAMPKSMSLPKFVQVKVVSGTTKQPFVQLSQPVAAKSSGTMLKSPVTSHGTLRVRMNLAIWPSLSLLG